MFAAIQFPGIKNYLFQLPGFDFLGRHVGPFPLRWYALAYIAGLVIGWRYMIGLSKNDRLWLANQRRPSGGECDDFLFWATLGVIVGGRLGFILFYMLPSPEQRDAIAHNPLTLIEIWNGGMSFHGGLIGVATAIVWFAREQKIAVLTLGDIVAACAPIGLFFGRLANFINGELWGRPSGVPWAVQFPGELLNDSPDAHEEVRQAIDAAKMLPHPLELNNAQDILTAYPNKPELRDALAKILTPRHPSQLYEACLEGLALFTILWLAAHKLKSFERPGLTIGIFLFCYGLFRFSLENVREPDATMPIFPFGLTMGMMLSAPMVIGGLALVAYAWNGRTLPRRA